MSKWSQTKPAYPPSWINTGCTSTSNTFMKEMFGMPRPMGEITNECKTPTNKSLLSKMVFSQDVGFLPSAKPYWKVSGIEPAVDSLRRIIEAVKKEHPEVHAAMGHIGMLCCRKVRGSTKSISNHSWGTAIDITFDGKYVPLGVSKIQNGLDVVYKYFHEEGWFWGAGFTRRDSMHFEVSVEKLREWYK